VDFYLTMLTSGIVVGNLYGLLGLGITFVLRVTNVLYTTAGIVKGQMMVLLRAAWKPVVARITGPAC